MDLSCELPRLDCVKKPNKTDIDKLKAANIAPNTLINSIFKDLEKNYNLMKKGSKTKSKTKTPSVSKSLSMSKTRSKSKSKNKLVGGRVNKYTRKHNMKGGALTAYQKNKITDMVILLVAGSSFWVGIPMLEAFIVSVGILPTLCGQNVLEHISANLFAAEGQSCSARAQRYNTVVQSLIAVITTAGWFSQSKFTKENLAKNYNKVHRQVKRTIFGPSDTPSPSPSPVPSSPPKKTPTPTPTPPSRSASPEKSPPRSKRSKHQQKQRQESEEAHSSEEEQSRGYQQEERSSTRRR